MNTVAKRVLWFTLPFAAVFYALSARDYSVPSGYVASYSIFPHDPNDVLNFAHGTVTLQTCCGDEFWGTYSRSADGAWVWHLRRGSKKPITREIQINSEFSSMSFIDLQDPSKTFTLRRRLFKRLPL